MQTINDFTCTLTNHNAVWLNIYDARVLYLTNVAYLDMCTVHVWACLNIQLCCKMQINSSCISVASVFRLTSVPPQKANPCVSCCDTDIRSTAGLPKKAKLQ